MSVCPKCDSINNVDIEAALKKTPVCGKCGETLKMHSLVSEISGKNLSRLIAKTDKPVIVDFWASWCGPCKVYGPQFEKASKENKDAIFLKVNTEENQQISQQLNIRGIPATVVFKNGKEIRREAGAMSSDQIRNLLS